MTIYFYGLCAGILISSLISCAIFLYFHNKKTAYINNLNKTIGDYRGIYKTIDEYREFIFWLRKKYPTFDLDIETDIQKSRLIFDLDSFLLKIAKLQTSEIRRQQARTSIICAYPLYRTDNFFDNSINIENFDEKVANDTEIAKNCPHAK
ncbi:MAG: hypothetical protein WC725_05035 [Patescibacteria group bacterium]|jgi:hypothetical protein